MTIFAWLFLVLLLASAGLAVWLAIDRTRATIIRARLEREAGEKEAAFRTLSAHAEAVRADAAATAKDAAVLRERCQALERAIEHERTAGERLLKEKSDALERQFRASGDESRAQFKALAGTVLGETQRQLADVSKQILEAQRQSVAREFDQRRDAVDSLVRPIAEALKQSDAKLAEIEKGWTSDRAGLQEKLSNLVESSRSLRDETHRLQRALRDPNVRGRYGEMQLRRVVEVAQMSALCDFVEQGQGEDADGRSQRPDLIVRLPGGRSLVVDAKANLQHYVEALHAPSPEEQESHLGEFARAVARQAADLAKKRYDQSIEGSPDFVVMFVPGDGFLDAALAREPDLLERSARAGVILASPSTLIALLRAVGLALQEQRVTEQARELRELGKELHDRACIVLEHLAGLGQSLGAAVERYNKVVASGESRLMPTLRKFEESGVRSGKDLPTLFEVKDSPRLPAP